MKINLFNYSIGTALVTTILYFILGLITSNDIFHLVLLIIIALVSIIIFSRKFPELASFKSGAILGLIIMASMLILNKAVHGRIEDLIIYLVTFAIVLVICGYIGKFSVKKELIPI
jgi:hypothetical protein